MTNDKTTHILKEERRQNMSNQQELFSQILQEQLARIFEKYNVSGEFYNQLYPQSSYPCDFIFEKTSGEKLLIEVKTILTPQIVEAYLSKLNIYKINPDACILISDSISQTLVDRYAESRLNFYSPNGASRIEIPGFCYIVKVQNRKKTVKGNSGTVFVGKASSLPRLFFSVPTKKWTQYELADAANITRGYASTNLKKMIENGYILCNDGQYELIEPDKMLNDWVAVYRFDRFVKKQMFAMHFNNYDDGLFKLHNILQENHIKFAFMGPTGAYLRCPYMEQNIITAYVNELPYEMGKLFPVEKDGNVVLYVPQSERFFLGQQEIRNLPVVSDIQLYLDLIKMPGRNEDQAEYLRENILHWG